MRVAYVHDWLVTYRGGEKVLESLLDLYPEAPIFTLFYDPQKMPPKINSRKVISPRWQAPLRSFRKALLPLMPTMVEAWDLDSYDLIISSSSAVAKGVLPGLKGRHYCYCHSPMRYIWDQRYEYLGRELRNPFIGWLAHGLIHYLRMWDYVSAQRVHTFVANSSFVQQRIAHYYLREAEVIHPPVELERFRPKAKEKRSDSHSFMLFAGALVPYKRADLAIKAAALSGKKLIIAGSGPEEQRLRSLATKLKAPVEFHIGPDDQKWLDLLSAAEALIFPGVEDFGITAIESLAVGTPVLALKAGGALDFINEGTNGLYFTDADSPESLCQLIKSFRPGDFDTFKVSASALDFGAENFKHKIRASLERVLK